MITCDVCKKEIHKKKNELMSKYWFDWNSKTHPQIKHMCVNCWEKINKFRADLDNELQVQREEKTNKFIDNFFKQ